MVLKVHGGKDLPILQCVNEKADKWLVLWDMQEEEEGSYIYKGAILEHAPTIEDIQTIINNSINDEVSKVIFSGLKIDNNIVYLSLENQLNYKAAYDLAYQTNGKNLPVTFKFGENYYKSFSTIEELEKFYIAVRTHIDSAVKAGWEKKEAIDYNKYKALIV